MSESEKQMHQAEMEQYQRPDFFKQSKVFLGGSGLDKVSKVTAVITVLLSLIFAVYFSDSGRLKETPVEKAVGWDTLRIDGNRAGMHVFFPHNIHEETAGEDRNGCIECHHLSSPGDGPTSCFECHKDMNRATSIFDHKYHQRKFGGNKSCEKCHEQNKVPEKAKSCAAADCHKDMFSDKSLIIYTASSYKDAMHKRCMSCHERDSEEPDKEYCGFCHRQN
ncbi:MAG: cytochrome c3 family protein [bacterium]